ncbi:Non-canonical purine NTP pyrophosphatase [compost metagenome]
MAGTDDDRADHILKKMENHSGRAAYFQSALAAVLPNGEHFTVEAKLHGSITMEPRGNRDSGYSRIFELPSGQTIAEMEPQEFMRKDHRRMAIEKLKHQLLERAGL